MNVFLEQVREGEFPAFKKKLQEAFTTAAKRQLPGISDEPIPSDRDIEESFYSPKAEAYYIMHHGKKVGGVVVSIDKETHHNSLDLFLFLRRIITVGLDSPRGMQLRPDIRKLKFGRRSRHILKREIFIFM